MHTAATAERNERKVTWIVSAVKGNQLQGVDHVVVCDPHNATCSFSAGYVEDTG